MVMVMVVVVVVVVEVREDLLKARHGLWGGSKREEA